MLLILLNGGADWRVDLLSHEKELDTIEKCCRTYHSLSLNPHRCPSECQVALLNYWGLMQGFRHKAKKGSCVCGGCQSARSDESFKELHLVIGDVEDIEEGGHCRFFNVFT